MSLKDWLREATGGNGQKAGEKYSIDELITLERYEEALTKLQERLRGRPQDNHARLKLAEVLMKANRRSEAVEEYLRVSEGFERDGFYNKAGALISRIARMVPNDERLVTKARRLERMKQLDHIRRVVVENLAPSIAMKVESEWVSFVQSDLLTRLSEAQLARLLPTLVMREFKEGDEVVSAGVRRDEMLWLVYGEISARVVLPNGSTTDLRSYSGGDLIGDRALFGRKEWPAVYSAAARSAVLVLDRPALEKALVGEDDPKRFLEALRADHNDDEVVEMVGKMSALRQEG